MLGSGIMDEAVFDLTMTVLRRVSAHLCVVVCWCVLCVHMLKIAMPCHV